MSRQFKNRSDKIKHQHIEDIRSITILFKKLFSVDVYLHYGTLLGAVRDHKFIPHDHEIDLAYLSKHSDPKKIRKEWDTILSFFKKMKLSDDFRQNAEKRFKYIIGKKPKQQCDKYYIRQDGPGQFHFWAPSGYTWFDMFTTWVDGSKLYLPRHVAGELSPSYLLPLRKCKLGHRLFNVPYHCEELLDTMYGTDWRTPIDWSIYKAAKARTVQDRIKAGKAARMYKMLRKQK